jgi:hypothetical protein
MQSNVISFFRSLAATVEGNDVEAKSRSELIQEHHGIAPSYRSRFSCSLPCLPPLGVNPESAAQVSVPSVLEGKVKS